MEYEVIITKIYKSEKCWINRIKKELIKAGIEDELDSISREYFSSFENGTTKRYNTEEKSIEEIIKEEDFCDSYKDEDIQINLDFRCKDFIYIYTNIK